MTDDSFCQRPWHISHAKANLVRTALERQGAKTSIQRDTTHNDDARVHFQAVLDQCAEAWMDVYEIQNGERPARSICPIPV